MKVNYSLSFLKELALDYFEPYIIDDPADEPLWVSDYTAFMEELYLYFGPYDQVADAKVELENLVMKDNHKATRFLIEFYRLSSMLQYNNSALHRRAYLALLKRIKNEMVHFDKPQSLNNLRDLVQKIDQRYWERCGELTRRPRPRPSRTSRPIKTKVPRTMTDVKVRVPAIPTPIPIWVKARKSRKETMVPTGIRNPNRTASERTENSPLRNANGAWIASSA
jgi:hypothetical protein